MTVCLRVFDNFVESDQWTGLCMIGTSNMKEFIDSLVILYAFLTLLMINRNRNIST